jgi:hypothetical protein
MPTDLELLRYEELAAFIFILGYTILVVAVENSIKMMIGTEDSTSAGGTGLTPAELTSISSWLRFLASVILSVVATIRLEERKARIESGEETGTINPNVKITTGGWLSTIGVFLIALGAQERVQEAGVITIQ